MAESDFIRVLDEDTGRKLTIRRRQLPHGKFKELDEPAVTPAGDVVAPSAGDVTTIEPVDEGEKSPTVPPGPQVEQTDGTAPAEPVGPGEGSEPEGDAPAPEPAVDEGTDAPAEGTTTTKSRRRTAGTDTNQEK